MNRNKKLLILVMTFILCISQSAPQRVSAMEIAKKTTVSDAAAVSSGAAVRSRKVKAGKNVRKQVAELVNKERKKRGKSKLTYSPKLTKAANKRAKEIVKSFSHTRPNGKSCFTVLDQMGINYGYCGENIAAGYRTAKAVMQGWMNSEGHKANILDKSYHYIGVGFYKSKKGYGYYWVQLFAESVSKKNGY